MPVRNVNTNPFTSDLLRASNCSMKATEQFTRHSLPLKPSNKPIVSKKLDGSECDPDTTSMWSARSDRSKTESDDFDDEDYNPFG